jgi:hypothetical protein
MSYHPDFRAPTGKPRGPAAYGAKALDPERDALRDQLRRFEAQADANDPEQQAVRASRPLGSARGRLRTLRGLRRARAVRRV